MPNKQDILKGREAVEDYRKAHHELHLRPWDKFVSAKHTPLLDKLKVALSVLGFNSLDEFFAASEQLNTEEIALGTLTLDKVWE